MSIMASPPAPALVSRSKIERPTLSGQWVRRPHIEARLDRAFDRSLILITAPAGHGKTSTIACWLELRGLDAAWLTVDERDADLSRFATHVAATLDRIAPRARPPWRNRPGRGVRRCLVRPGTGRPPGPRRLPRVRLRECFGIRRG